MCLHLVLQYIFNHEHQKCSARIVLAAPLIGPSRHPQPLDSLLALNTCFDLSSETMADSKEACGIAYEAQHVHSVYEEIASHFSSTRYKVCVISGVQI